MRSSPILRIIFGIFFLLHGLVYMLYLGQSRRLFELKSGLVWPDGSWAFSKILGDQTTRTIAGISCVLSAVGFTVGGAAVLASQNWRRSLIVGMAVFSSVAFVLLWNKTKRRLADQGGIGILINIAILVAVLAFRWPDFKF